MRTSSITYHLAKHLMYTRFRDHGEEPPLHLFGQIKRVVRDWIDGGYLVCSGGTVPAMVTYREMAEKAADRIYLACQRQERCEKRIKAILDAYNPSGSTRFVKFATSKLLYKTSPQRCHINYVVCDSEWEAELARVLESHPRVPAYAKNQGLQLEVPIATAACRESTSRISSCRWMTDATTHSTSFWKPRAAAAASLR